MFCHPLDDPSGEALVLGHVALGELGVEILGELVDPGTIIGALIRRMPLYIAGGQGLLEHLNDPQHCFLALGIFRGVGAARFRKRHVVLSRLASRLVRVTLLGGERLGLSIQRGAGGAMQAACRRMCSAFKSSSPRASPFPSAPWAGLTQVRAGRAPLLAGPNSLCVSRSPIVSVRNAILLQVCAFEELVRTRGVFRRLAPGLGLTSRRTRQGLAQDPKFKEVCTIKRKCAC